MTRKSTYTDEVANQICERLLERDLVAICSDKDMPSRSTVYAWMDENPEFRTRCARAREGLVDHELHGIKKVMEDVLSGALDPAAAKVVISHIQWRAEKIAPNKYGQKIQQEISGPGGTPVAITQIRIVAGDGSED